MIDQEIKDTDNNVIIVRNLSKKYGQVQALKNVSFNVKRGELFSLLGPNGAGKTTLLRAITGSLRIPRGKVFIEGYDVSKHKIRIKEITGFVSENHMLFPEIKVIDNLLFVSKLHGLDPSKARKRIMELAELLGFKDFLYRKYDKLSKGFKRRVDIASALIHSPRILILDEPTGGLDLHSSITLREIISELIRNGVTIVMATHYIAEAMNISNRVLILVNGEVKNIGEPSELRKMLSKTLSIEINVDDIKSDLVKVVNEMGGIIRSNKIIVLELKIDEVANKLNELLQYLSQRNIMIRGISVKELTWEEVYLMLTGLKCPYYKNRKCYSCPLMREMQF